MYTTQKELEKALSTICASKTSSISITNEKLLREKIIDRLILTAVFSKDPKLQKESRAVIRELCLALQVFPSSIHNFYHAIGEGRVKPNFTVPAINIRCLTYDTARIIFRLMKEKAIGPIVFEIARSEIEYTNQYPDEYAISILAAAIKEGYKGPVFLQGDHYQLSARRFKENNEKEIDVIKSLIEKSIEAAFYNIILMHRHW